MQDGVRVAVLGPVEVSVAGDPIDLMSSLRALVAALAIDEGRVVSVDQLTSRLWEHDEPRATVTLQSYVSRLRTRLRDAAGQPSAASVVRTRAPGYQLVVGEGCLDVQHFRVLIRKAQGNPDRSAARASVDEALALWRGPAYADVPMSFAATERARLADQLLRARELRIELDLDLGRHRAVLDELKSLLAEEPLREDLWASYALALYRSDRQADALAALNHARAELREQLGVDPGPKLRELQERILRQDPGLDPVAHEALVLSSSGSVSRPAATTDRTPAGTPRTLLVEPPTSLVGRESELTDLTDLVHAGGRLVTLTGFGGVGKTRLALALAQRLDAEFPAGVVLVPLATVDDPDLVLPSVAHALGHDVAPGPETATVLADLLAGQRLLMVLDNVEHLLAAAIDVARLVALLPDLTVVVTSRAPLRVNGEQEYLVRPLDVPETAHRSVGLEEVRSSPAVDLFTQRARAVSPRFRLDATNAPAVAEICQRLGGIPLAVELAVARLRILGPDALLARLDDALGAGPRDLPQRQRTMQATLDWSYRLLDADAQRLYRRLSVFTGGWTLSALHAIEGPTVHNALETLVEHSLVTTSWGGHDTRYRMLEPTAQHARSLLTAAGLREAAEAHAAYYLGMSERASLGFLSGDQLDWLEAMDHDHANVLRAFEWSMENDDSETAGRIVWAMWLYWWWRSYTAVGRRAVAAALQAPDMSGPVRVRARLAGAALAFAQGDLDASEEGYAAVADSAGASEDIEPLANATAGLGIVALARGDLEATEELQREAIRLGTTLGDDGYGPWITSLGHCWLGSALAETGRRDEATDHFEQGLRLARASGDRLAAYTTLWYLARSEAARDREAARQHLLEGVRLARGVGDLTNLSYFLDALVSVEATPGDEPSTDQAQRHARLLGAAAAFREADVARAISYYLPDDDARDEASHRARHQLGGEDYAAAMLSGRAMSLEAAVQLALAPPITPAALPTTPSATEGPAASSGTASDGGER